MLQAWERGREGSYVWNSGPLIAMWRPAERSAPRLKDLSQPGALPWLHDSPSQLTAQDTSPPCSQAPSSPSGPPTGHPAGQPELFEIAVLQTPVMALTSGFIAAPGEGRGEAAVGWDGVASGSFRAGIQSRATNS